MLTYERHVRSKLVCAYDAALTQKIVGVHVIMKSMQIVNTVVDMLLLKRDRRREHLYNGPLNYRLARKRKICPHLALELEKVHDCVRNPTC